MSSAEAAFDGFLASFVETGALTEARADELTDAVASAGTEAAREQVMCSALGRLLQPGMVVALTSPKSATFKVRMGTVMYVPPDKRKLDRVCIMLSEADGSNGAYADVGTVRPAPGGAAANPSWHKPSLYWATEANDLAAMSGLIEANADVDGAYLGNSPLLRACMHRHEEAANLLLDAGADAKLSIEDGCTPLIMLAEPVDGEPSDAPGARLVARLLRAGAASTLEECDCNGCTPLALAALRGNVQVAAALLEGGANVNAADSEGLTPLMLCFVADADDGPVDGPIATRAMVRLLLSAGAQVSAVDAEGRDALWFCRNVGRIDLMRLLHEAEEDDDDAYGPDGMRLDADAAERLFTTMCVQRVAENQRIGRREDDNEVARQVANSPFFLAALDGRKELREDHQAFSDAYFAPTGAEEAGEQ